ncbi:MAG: hypothetical protein RLZZ53_2300 [Acidobacteriota bacterium]|jgi:hypothetical protein
MNGEAPKKKRTWLWVLGGVFVLFVFVAIGGLFFAISFFRDNMQVTRDVTESKAVSEFDAVYSKYPGQTPLIQLVNDRPQLVADRAGKGSGSQVTTLHVLAFDSNSEEMVRFSLPFWLLRMKSGPIRLSAYQQGWDDRGVSFDIADIEKAGPGIVIDAKERREGRLLVWTE